MKRIAITLLLLALALPAGAATIELQVNGLVCAFCAQGISKTLKRFPATRDVYVSLEDPTGMRALVPYLMKPESWTLIKCEMTSSTSRHYRFQKVASNDGKALPDVDIFRIRR